MTINLQFGKSEILKKSSISVSASNAIVGKTLDYFSDILEYSIDLPKPEDRKEKIEYPSFCELTGQTEEEFRLLVEDIEKEPERLAFGKILEKEKAILTERQRCELERMGYLEGDFVYDEVGNPISFRSIDDVDFSEPDMDFTGIPPLPTTQEEFKNRFGGILQN